jgi:predicted metalloprotease with PDZ domain
MSSASPGRYARHEFAKNVFDVHAFDGTGAEVMATRPNPHEWVVAHHNGSVHFRYRLFGSRVDGTYLAVDSRHAHMNMPATLMWGLGLEDRPVRVVLEPPVDANWKVATQLYPTNNPMAFTAPNLQYLMDSPIELSDFELHSFSVADPSSPANQPIFRIALHHDSRADVTRYMSSVEAIVRETVLIFGEFPVFETNTYTFIADYLTDASGDAMEHRNSTVLTSNGRIDVPEQVERLLGSAAHEFFHVWNVERIRPQSLEPFDFTDANLSGELWLAEGFTNYYGKLVMQRSGLTTLRRTLDSFGSTLNLVVSSPGRLLNSAVQMSRLAAFTDAATAIDPTNFDNTFISYYSWGEAIALGLDLSLRVRTGGAVTLDHYMQALWERFGEPGGVVPGLVDNPYTLADVRSVMATVSGDDRFAAEFFEQFIEGRDVVNYAELLEHAGLILQPQAPGQPSLGRVHWGIGMAVIAATPYGSPLYNAGIDRGDVVTTFDGKPVSSMRDLERILQNIHPGETVAVGFLRQGTPFESRVALVEDQAFTIVAIESTGQVLSAAQEAFRNAWFGSLDRLN